MDRRKIGQSILVAAVLVLTSSLGCKKQTPEPAPAPSAIASATPAPPVRQVGEKVDVQWNGSWWKASILAFQDGKYRIHYTGWGDNWDENVTPDRVRDQTEDSRAGTSPEPDVAKAVPAAAPVKAAAKAPSPATSTTAPAPTASAATSSGYAVGSRVDVNWKGTWYQGKILSKSGNNYRVHYIGWASSWDENVTASRLRPFTGSAARGSGPE